MYIQLFLLLLCIFQYFIIMTPFLLLFFTIDHFVHHPESGLFILSYARRNVPIDKVLCAAEKRGLTWRVADDRKETNTLEPVYLFSWALS